MVQCTYEVSFSMSDKKKFPRTGFGRLAGDMVRRYYTHDVARDSAALTYYLLFAIFPLLIFISTLLGLLELDGAYIASVLEPLLPADVLNVLQSYLDYVSANQSRQLLWFSLVFSIWFPMRAAGCLMHSVRKAFGCGAPESMWRSQLRILLFTMCLILSIAITLVLVVVGRTVLEFAGRIITVSEAFITAWSYLRFVALALVMTVLLVLSMAFSYYVEHVGQYSVLYGSIATVIVVLLWLYMSGQILVLGAEFSAALIDRETTAAPLGEEEGK